MYRTLLFFLLVLLPPLPALSIGNDYKLTIAQSTDYEIFKAKKSNVDKKRVNERYNKPFDKYYANRNKDNVISYKYENIEKKTQATIPRYVLKILAYIRQHNRVPTGFVGGRRFGNFEGHLPRRDLEGRPIGYREWDVRPKIKGQNRGAERLVTGSDGRAWYTNDHYNSFTEVR